MDLDYLVEELQDSKKEVKQSIIQEKEKLLISHFMEYIEQLIIQEYNVD